ncbi:MAG TPA: gfo/Idh/MocA family oxidoreductase, partial [bacterium]|nr:gfo/Idh/MocA family oxidoreductase [bacterium]
MTPESPKPNNRRAFLKTTASGLTLAAMIGPASRSVPGANNLINIGVIGVGGRGTSLVRELVDRKDCKVVAVCDVYEKRVKRAMGICGGEGY